MWYHELELILKQGIRIDKTIDHNCTYTGFCYKETPFWRHTVALEFTVGNVYLTRRVMNNEAQFNRGPRLRSR